MKPIQRIKVTLCVFNHCDFRWIVLSGKVLDFLHFSKLFHLVGKDFPEEHRQNLEGC